MTLHYIYMFLLSMVNAKLFIKNGNYPACVNCEHFAPYSNLQPFMDKEDTVKFGKCKLFGKKDLITDKVDNYYASTCRETKEMCGEKGKYYQEKLVAKNVGNFTFYQDNMSHFESTNRDMDFFMELEKMRREREQK